MDIGTNLIFLIIFGLFGFVISKIWDINPYRIFSDLMGAFLIIILLIAMAPALIDPSNAIETIPNVVEVFANNLPGIIIGDIAGTIIALITLSRRLR